MTLRSDRLPASAEDRADPEAAALRAAREEAARERAAERAAADRLAPRTLYLHRRVVTITPERIEVRPPRSALILPLLGVAATAGLLALLVTATDSLPFWTLPILLMVSVLLLPLSGISLVYAVFGANYIADRAGQNVSLKQKFLGLGVGTNELIPFWKIREFLVEDVGRPLARPEGDVPAHDIAQWQLTLIKKSGARHEIGGYSVPREREEEGLDAVMEVAEALSALTEAPIRGPIW